jgi:hypothetical protein
MILENINGEHRNHSQIERIVPIVGVSDVEGFSDCGREMHLIL